MTLERGHQPNLIRLARSSELLFVAFAVKNDTRSALSKGFRSSNLDSSTISGRRADEHE